MKAMIVKSFGGPEVFELAELQKPEIKAGYVLVNISATSVNMVDTMIRQMGKELPLSPKAPAILGMDFAGTVEAVGEGVVDFSVGDAVYGCAGGLGDLPGTLAEYIVADAKLIALKPTNLTMREAAAIPLVGITAYEGLMRAGISEGQSVLVHGGAGGVGHLAVQLANHFGAKVFATASNDKDSALIEEMGATAINYKTEAVADYVAKHTEGAGFDIIFDSVGGENMIKSFEAAALNGQVASTSSMVEIDLTGAHVKGLSLHVVFMLIPMIYNQKREVHGQILSDIAKIAEAGKLKPIVDKIDFSLADIGAAHTRLTSGEATGKVVVEIK